MMKLERLLPLAAMLTVVVAMEVSEIRWAGDRWAYANQYAKIIDKPVVMTAICKYSLMENDPNVRVTISKDGVPIETTIGYHPPYEVSRKNGVVEYQFEGDIKVESRGDEGLVTCRMEDNHSNNKPKKSIYLYVAIVASGEDTEMLPSSIKMDKCSLKFMHQTTWSDPPLQARCGIWQRNVMQAAETSGNWVPQSKQLKNVYSTEDSDWQLIKYPVKNLPLKSATSSYQLTAHFNMAERPKDKMLEVRCKFYYKFESERHVKRVDVENKTKRIMDDFRYRCPAISSSLDSEHGKFTSLFNEDYTTDCMGMISSLSEIKGIISCDRNVVGDDGMTNSTETYKIMCRDFRWKEHGSGSIYPISVDSFIDRCSEGGYNTHIPPIVEGPTGDVIP